ncbi:MAG: Polysaccharide export [Desulfovibrionaceae bacterium]|nr:MAG: Polysaccharide export [Desulfovibrionaceae bacterium]
MSARRIILAIALCTAMTASAYAAEPDVSYRPGPDDVLYVSVWKDEALTREVVVRPDGKISFPLIGDVAVQGRTISEVREEIQAKMNEFAPDAPVSIMVVKINSPKVFIVGKVLRPGVYLMSDKMSVMQALSLAGGFTPFSAKDDILVLREARGKLQSLPFDYDAVAKGKHLEQNIDLIAGDTIVVP